MRLTIKFAFLTLVAVICTGAVYGQQVLGTPLSGTQLGQQFGAAVTLSDTGDRIAVGSPRASANSLDGAGRVDLFDWDGSEWQPYPSRIEGSIAGANLGRAVMLSADGSTLAVGAPGSSDAVSEAGSLAVYSIGADELTLLASIDGLIGNANWGGALAMSADGSSIAVGASRATTTVDEDGLVQVYRLANGTLEHVGQTIVGADALANLGRSLDLSADGTRLVIGASGGLAGDRGYVEVYDLVGDTWTLAGDRIDGQTSGDQTGFAVSISGDGNRIAVSSINFDAAFNNQGQVILYDWNGTSWLSVPGRLNGSADGYFFANDLELSQDGMHLVASSTAADIGGENTGEVRFFTFNGRGFLEEFSVAGAPSDFAGSAVATNGERIVVGSRLADAGGFISAGKVTTYQAGDASPFVEPKAPTPLLVWPNPTPGSINLGRERYEQISVVDATGRSVALYQEGTNQIDLSVLGAGVYMIRARTADGPQQASVVVY